jgi:hypothetical protein
MLYWCNYYRYVQHRCTGIVHRKLSQLLSSLKKWGLECFDWTMDVRSDKLRNRKQPVCPALVSLQATLITNKIERLTPAKIFELKRAWRRKIRFRHLLKPLSKLWWKSKNEQSSSWWRIENAWTMSCIIRQERFRTDKKDSEKWLIGKGYFPWKLELHLIYREPSEHNEKTTLHHICYKSIAFYHSRSACVPLLIFYVGEDSGDFHRNVHAYWFSW